jgi:hypothetical protein
MGCCSIEFAGLLRNHNKEFALCSSCFAVGLFLALFHHWVATNNFVGTTDAADEARSDSQYWPVMNHEGQLSSRSLPPAC